MLIQMKKQTDSGSLLRCTREDGSIVWQRHVGARARFFPLHDLEHFAVEALLGEREGFYGLIASGWAIEETSRKGARGKLPPRAVAIEHLVGMLDADRAGSSRATASELNEHARSFASGHGLPAPLLLTEEILDRIRERVEELHLQWLSLPPNEIMELTFPPGLMSVAA